ATLRSITTILRCMRRSMLTRQPSRRLPGSNTWMRTPASMSDPMKRSDRSGEPKPSMVTSTCAPRRAHQRLVQLQPDLVLEQDESFQDDFFPGVGDAGEHAREVLLAVFEEVD